MEALIAKFLHYKGHWLAILAAVLGTVGFIICVVLDNNSSYSPWAFMYRIEKLILLASLAGIWIATAIFTLTSVYYSDKTGGRSLFHDRRDYHRTMAELLRTFRDADPYRMKEDDLAYISWKNASGVILGKSDHRLIYRRTWEHGGDGANYIVFALPGAGKTTSQIIPSALRFGGSVLAIDIKGDLLNACHDKRKIKVFAPDDPKVSVHYNPLAGIEKLRPSELKTFVEQMAIILIPEEHGNDSKYFTDGARDLFCAIALYLIREKQGITLPDIARQILTGNVIDWINKIRDSDCTEAREYSDSYWGTNETNVSGCGNELAKHIRPFASGELAELLSDDGHCITPETLDDGYDIYIEIPQDKIQVLAPITTLLVQNFMTAFMRRTDNSSGKMIRPVLFLLDEVMQMQISGEVLTGALSTLRSKGVSIYMAVQSIGQIRKKYGEDQAREIIDTCAYVSVMSAQDPESRKYFSELFGSRRVLKVTSNDSVGTGSWWDASQHGNSSSRGAQEVREPIFQPEDFGNLGDRVAILANGKYIVADKCYWWK